MDVFAPMIGLVLGISSRGKEPSARGRAGWGVALNALAPVGWMVTIAVLVGASGLAVFARLFGA